jgi:hypothetical protein
MSCPGSATLTLMAGIDLLTGNVHAVVKERHRSREFIEFLKLLDTAYPADTAIEVILDNQLRLMSQRRPRPGLPLSPLGALPSLSRPSTAHGSISSRASSPSWRARCSATSGFAQNTNSESVLMAFINDINHEPIVPHLALQNR